MPDFPNPFASKTDQELSDMDEQVSDILCWVRGFNAAYIGNDGPFGVEGVRQLRRILKKELAARKGQS